MIIWVRQISGYLIISSILKHLLPQKQYGAYVRLFLNLLLVLLLLRPLLKLDIMTIDGVWKEASAQTGITAAGWREQLERLVQEENTEKQLEYMVQETLKEILEEEGYRILEIKVWMDENSDPQILLRVCEAENTLQSPVIREKDGILGANKADELTTVLRRRLQIPQKTALKILIEKEVP